LTVKADINETAGLRRGTGICGRPKSATRRKKIRS